MNYIKVNIALNPLQPAREIVYADLEINGFESIVDTDTGVDAYIPEDQFELVAFDDMMVKAMPDQEVEITIEKIEKQNWNATWESNFEVISVNDKCSIRAPFHAHTAKEVDVIIAPQMSFGTGHHETTFLISKRLFDIEIANKTVLDMGCGTAVLAVIAHKLGALSILAIDIEDWAYHNAIDNCALNGINDIEIQLGDAELIKGKTFEIIIANINRNVLLQDIATYSDCLEKNGQLLLSGFYNTDIPVLQAKAESCGLEFVYAESLNNWTVLQFNKN